MEGRILKIVLGALAAFFVFGAVLAAMNENVSYTITARGTTSEETSSGFWETITGGYWEDQQSGYWERSGAGLFCDFTIGGEGEAGSINCHEERVSDCQSYWDNKGPTERHVTAENNIELWCQENPVWRDTSTRVWRDTSTRVWRDTSTTEKKSWFESESGSFTIACDTDKYITTSSLRAPDGNTSWSVSDNNPLVSTSMSGPSMYATNVSPECGGPAQPAVPSGSGGEGQASEPSAPQGGQGNGLPPVPSEPSSQPPSPPPPPPQEQQPPSPTFEEI